jgi:hypothetical protein
MSIRPEHIVAGNQEAILALLWNSAVKLQVDPLLLESADSHPHGNLDSDVISVCRRCVTFAHLGR